MVAREHFSTVSLLGIWWLLAGTGAALAPPEPLQVRFDTSSTYQVIDGFGASDAWQSEYFILEPANSEIAGGSRRDLRMNTALYVARIIHHDLTIAQARSWQWWTAVSEVDYKDGLVCLDDGSKGNGGSMGPETRSLMRDGVVRDSKLLWVLGNYARFIRPGMTRVAFAIEPEQSFVDGVLASAYTGSDHKLVLVLINLSRERQRCDPGLARQFDVYTTYEKANLERTQQNGSGIAFPARAVVTCVSR